MVKVFTVAATTAAFAVATASAASVPDGTWPTSQGDVYYTESYTVAAGETFDGGLKTYQRSDITCEGQEESGSSTAVFLVEAGGTLKNVIIGADQMEGVHCNDHDCTIENVWWDDVCEDALSIKGSSASSVSTVTGGGARNADDKVIQHNGYGTVNIDGFYADTFGKLYRSCGTCGDRQRFVTVSNIYAVNPSVSIVTVNENYGDEATLSNIWISSDDDGYAVCAWSEGSEDGEPTELGDGIKDPLCQYSESDIHVNEDVSTAASTSSNTTTLTTSTTTSTIASASASATGTSTSSSVVSTTGSASTTTEESSTPVSSLDGETSVGASAESASSSVSEETSAPSASEDETSASSSSSYEATTSASESTEAPTTSSNIGEEAETSVAGSSASTPSVTTATSTDTKCNTRNRNRNRN
ncbi:hypothetical protein PC121_g17404 [Phytophthora cactorum]|nr:hypothetical protein PC120_g15671 [Phytophthora cactorum]KAG3052225.1 hypothetical protein PC121_g17404 [Phytophthora cactorum]KAG4056789.1 hypothetical protein PC123_g8163 [Phytophthora cactorum]